MVRFPPVAACALAATPALAGMAAPGSAPSPCPLTYPQFYAAFPHADLDRCPKALEGPSRFCRLVEGANGLSHVFVFTVEGAQCLLEARQFGPEALRLAAD